MTPPTKSTARVNKLRDRYREAGMVLFYKWVTPEQDAALKALLDQWKETE